MVQGKKKIFKRFVIRIKADEKIHKEVYSKIKELADNIIDGYGEAEFVECFIQIYPEDRELDRKFVLGSIKVQDRDAGLYKEDKQL
jgi:hypothetical protein